MEFVSKLEELIPAKELTFKPTLGFGKYAHFLEHGKTHPAKMNTSLVEFLINTYSKPGDVILDPMAGSGSTGIIAYFLRRNAVCVELEERFFNWMEQARVLAKKHPTLFDLGWIRNIRGDARQLSSLLQNVDTVVTSPPYSDSLTSMGNKEKRMKRLENITTPNKHTIKHVKRGKFSDTDVLSMNIKYSDDPANIGNLQHGDIDAVITSPPYANVVLDAGNVEKRLERLEKVGIKDINKHRFGMEYKPYNKENPENIGNLPHGSIDAVVTSPPYSNIDISGGDQEKRKERLKEHGHDPEEFFGGEARNVTLEPYVDTVVTSPPYEDGMGAGRAGKAIRTGQSKIQQEKGLFRTYSEDLNKENIGNMHSSDYLSAMQQVYSEIYKVLKPVGVAVIVVKPFIKDKQVIDLPYQTWQLLESVGFALIDLYKLRIDNPSFWRVLYQKKYPDVPKLRHEYCVAVVR